MWPSDIFNEKFFDSYGNSRNLTHRVTKSEESLLQLLLLFFYVSKRSVRLSGVGVWNN